MIERPEVVKDAHLDYLDKLRESGETNMYGSGPYVEREFLVTRRQAQDIVIYWMESFEERHA